MLAESAAGLSASAAPLLECRGIDVCVESRTLVRGLNLRVGRGSVLAVLGPNGSGKSLSLHTLAGLRSPKAGELLISDRPLADWPRRALARELALLPQNVEDPFPATVMETVLLGRHPHIARWQWESARDLAIASDALAAVGLAGYEERDVLTLSGGERRRAALARCWRKHRASSCWTSRPISSIPTINSKRCSYCESAPMRGPPSSSPCMIQISPSAMPMPFC